MASPIIDITKDFTVEIFFNPTTVGGELLSQNHIPAGARPAPEFTFNAGKLRMTIVSDAPVAYNVDTTTSISSATWYQGLGTWQVSTGNMEIFLNAVSEDTETLVGTSHVPTTFAIGARILTGPTVDAFFNGDIAIVRYWQRILGTTEMEQLRNLGKGLQFDDLTTDNKVSLINAYDFDEASGSLIDKKGSTNLTENGTIAPVAGPGA